MLARNKARVRSPFAVVFDLDGTLVDASGAIVDGFNHVLDRHSVRPYGEEQVLRMMGRPLRDMFAEIAVTHRLDVAQLVSEYVDYSRALSGRGIQLLPGALALLERCRSYCRVGVNTSRTTSSARRILGGLGVNHLLPEIVGLDQVRNPKPHPEGLQLVLGRLGAIPQDSIMLGDTPDDIQAALAVGARAFGVATGYFSTDDLRSAGAGEVFSNLAEFEVRLNQLNRKIEEKGTP